jgi:hypothetical protein
MRTNPLVGKKITAVYLAEDGCAIKFDIEGGKPIIARAYGDCCSYTWIEYVETPEHLLGTVQSVKDLALDKPDAERDENEGEYIQYYGCKISTEKGSCLLDYRNSSNGYYGGNLEWPGDFNHYGPHSKETWKKLA